MTIWLSSLFTSPNTESTFGRKLNILRDLRLKGAGDVG